MDSSKQQVGRTKWDILVTLLQNRNAVRWIAAVASLLVVLLIVALWTGYATLQFGRFNIGRGQVLACRDYEFELDGGEKQIAPANKDLEVHGRAPKLPAELKIYLVSTSKEGLEKGYWTPRPATISDDYWTVTVPADKTGNPGDIEYYAIFIVGKDGEALFNAYRKTMEHFSRSGEMKWPPYTETTSDMVVCLKRLEVRLHE